MKSSDAFVGHTTIMIEDFLRYEREAFFALNGSDSAFLDRFMFIYTGKAVWLPLAVFIVIILFYKKNWREWLLITLSLVLLITLCDQFASTICKPLFMRFRPTHHPDFMDQVKTVFGYRGGRYGFISSHAANAFGFAMFMALLLRNKLFTWTIFIWATLTAYTRIYLGVHFISDIIPGILAGLLFGTGVYYLYRFCYKKWLRQNAPLYTSVYSAGQIDSIVIAIYVTILCIMIFNRIRT